MGVDCFVILISVDKSPGGSRESFIPMESGSGHKQLGLIKAPQRTNFTFKISFSGFMKRVSARPRLTPFLYAPSHR